MTSLNVTDTYVNGKLLESPWQESNAPYCYGVKHYYEKIYIYGVPYINRVAIHKELGHRERVGGQCSKNPSGSLPGLENLDAIIYRNVVDVSRTSVIPASQLHKIWQSNPALLAHLRDITNITR